MKWTIGVIFLSRFDSHITCNTRFLIIFVSTHSSMWSIKYRFIRPESSRCGHGHGDFRVYEWWPVRSIAHDVEHLCYFTYTRRARGEWSTRGTARNGQGTARSIWLHYFIEWNIFKLVPPLTGHDVGVCMSWCDSKINSAHYSVIQMSDEQKWNKFLCVASHVDMKSVARHSIPNEKD